MVNAKRLLESDDSDQEQKQALGASRSQLNAGSASKRARLATNGNGHSSPASGFTRIRPTESDDEEDDVDELATPAPQAGPSRQAATQRPVAMEDVSLQEDSSEGDEEGGSGDEESNDNEDNVRDKAMSGTNTFKGKVAEAGVVDTVVLKNFMCHKHMEVKLSPQINFIIGHNGSGKSVILTAITYALGAKASASNRGTSQNSFIRTGAPSCEVTLALRNKGEEAYKPEIYGKTIYITRRTSVDGAGGYRIANWERKTIATTRGELSAICDHFQIQIDNPVNILHQDMAKLFLHSSKPTDKYRFFLKGTQLEQLLEEYQVILHQTQALQNITKSKSGKLVGMKEKMKAAQSKWREIELHKTVEQSIAKMKNELAWAHVVGIEEQTQAAVIKQIEEQEKVTKIGKKVKAAEEEFQIAKTKLEEAQAAEEDDDVAERLTRELAEVTARIKDFTAQMSEARAEQREMQENILSLRIQVAERDKELMEEASKADGPLRQRMLQSRERLAQIEQKREELAAQIEMYRTKVSEMGRLFDEERENFDTARNQQNTARQALEHAESAVRNLQASQENALNRFGNFAANIVMAIDREKGWIQKPIGPMGNFIKLKDPRWAKVCESVCGDRLNAFLVSNDEDRFRLNGLIRRFNRARHNVLVFKWDDTFEADLQCNLPSRQYTTMLDVLSFDNEYVRQAFIATASPEASVLVEERRVGDDLMRYNDPVKTRIRGCYSMDLYSLGGLYGGSRMTAMQPYRGPPRLSKDIEAEKQRALTAKMEAEERLRKANDERARMDRLLASYTQQKKQAETEGHSASSLLRRLELERNKLLDESRDFQPGDVQATEEAKQHALEEIESIKAQGQTSTNHLKELEQACKPFVQRKEEIQTLLRQTEDIKRSRQDAMEALVTVKINKEHEVKAWEAKKVQHSELAQRLDAEVAAHAERLQRAMDQANEMCPRNEIEKQGKDVKKLENSIASLEKALRQQEQALGGSSEEIYKRYVKAKGDYEHDHQVVKDLKDCADTMLEAYEIRMNRWVVFRTHIATKARIQFIRHLAQRGYTGDLRFRHDDHRLDLRVQPNDDPENKKSQRSKDSSTLSGGEKSFSTICLLLALWSTAGCPIRGLDEYDVFMDPVNRKVATNMLISAGHAANDTQMILISPQAMQGHANTAGVKIIRIADPERGQGTLATDTTG